MLGDFPCLKNDVIVDVDDLNSLSSTIETLIVGNECLNKLTEIDLSKYVYVRMIDVGYDSLKNVMSVVISSMII